MNWEASGPENPWRLRPSAGHVVLSAGLALIVAGVLYISSAAYGNRPLHSVTERHPYNEIKPQVHEAFIPGFSLGLSGLALALVGSRMLSRGRRAPGQEEPLA